MSKNSFLLLFIFTIITLSFSNTSHANKNCRDLLNNQSKENKLDIAEEISQSTAEEARKTLESLPLPAHSKKGYAILIGTMVGSAAATSFLGTQLPPEFQFTSIFLAQLSTLGVYVFGAPIWEPLTSKFRKWAFGLSQDKFSPQISNEQLEELWVKTQDSYSLNAQMSRNLINQFLLNVKQNFYEAYRAHSESNREYSADQIAEAAYRMRYLFKDISPDDPSVAAAIKTAFTNHIVIDDDFKRLVSEKINDLDPEADLPIISKYYDILLNHWL